MTRLIVPPGSIPSTTPPGDPQRQALQPPPAVFVPQPVKEVGAPGLGPGFALSDHVHAAAPTKVVSGGGTLNRFGANGDFLTFTADDYFLVTLTPFDDPTGSFDSGTNIWYAPVDGAYFTTIRFNAYPAVSTYTGHIFYEMNGPFGGSWFDYHQGAALFNGVNTHVISGHAPYPAVAGDPIAFAAFQTHQFAQFGFPDFFIDNIEVDAWWIGP